MKTLEIRASERSAALSTVFAAPWLPNLNSPPKFLGHLSSDSEPLRPDLLSPAIGRGSL